MLDKYRADVEYIDPARRDLGNRSRREVAPGQGPWNGEPNAGVCKYSWKCWPNRGCLLLHIKEQMRKQCELLFGLYPNCCAVMFACKRPCQKFGLCTTSMPLLPTHLSYENTLKVVVGGQSSPPCVHPKMPLRNHTC